jgi:hypothetical protein
MSCVTGVLRVARMIAVACMPHRAHVMACVSHGTHVVTGMVHARHTVTRVAGHRGHGVPRMHHAGH